MARDAITPVQLTRDTGVDGKAATVMTAITVANGAYIDVSNIDCEKLVIHVKNTEGSTNAVTIKKGIYSRSPLGDLSVTVAATSGEQLINVESSRFKNADGHILIDFESGMTGLVGAYILP